MILEVVNRANQRKGYLVDNIYIPNEVLKYFTSDNLSISKTIYGKSSGRNIKVGITIYKNILGIRDYRKVLGVLLKNNIVLNDIIFIKSSIDNINTSELSSIWSKRKKSFNTYICLHNFNEVGLILTKDDIFKSENIYISMIEVFNKGNKDGTLIVSELKRLGKSLSGLCFISAVDFWKKCGASISENLHFKL